MQDEVVLQHLKLHVPAVCYTRVQGDIASTRQQCVWEVFSQGTEESRIYLSAISSATPQTDYLFWVILDENPSTSYKTIGISYTQYSYNSHTNYVRGESFLIHLWQKAKSTTPFDRKYKYSMCIFSCWKELNVLVPDIDWNFFFSFLKFLSHTLTLSK